MIRKFRIWRDNGECKNEEDLANPLMVVEAPDASLAAEWAASEVLNDFYSEGTLLVHDVDNDAWSVIELTKSEWTASDFTETDLDEIMNG